MMLYFLWSILLHTLVYSSAVKEDCKDGDEENCLKDDIGWARESDFKSIQRHGDYLYFNSLRTDYKMRIQRDSVQIKVDIRIDPCRNYLQTGGTGKNCCRNSNIVACQNHPYDIRAGTDLQLAYFQNAHIPTCTKTLFENDPNCGTYIEIHRAVGEYSKEAVDILRISDYTGPSGDPEMERDYDAHVISDVKIDTEYPEGFQTLYIGTQRLCSGCPYHTSLEYKMFFVRHELWWVVRTVHAGPFVLRRIPFYVYQPTCATPDLLEEEKELIAAARLR